MTHYVSLHIKAKGRAVIPAELRAEANIGPGDTLLGHVDEEGRLIFETREVLKRHLRTQFAAPAQPGDTVEDVVDELRAERREAAARERAREEARARGAGA